MKFIQNIILLIFTTILTIALLNLIIVFNSLKIFDQDFLPRHWALNSDRYFLTFYPNTHDKTLKKNYTAIIGDSISFGEGDGWVNYENKYSISHYLANEKRNYLNFQNLELIQLQQ